MRNLGAIILICYLVGCRAVERSDQKRSMADLATIGSAVQAYACDHGSYPQTDTLDGLYKLIAPEYMRVALREDGWGTPFRYVCWREFGDSPGCDRYAVISAGSDRKFEPIEPRLFTKSVKTDDPAVDLVYSNGHFLRNPPGFEPVIMPEELWAKLQKSEVTLVDARHPDEYRAVHIKNSINIPDHQLRARSSEIPRDKPIVVFGAEGCGISREDPYFELVALNGFKNVSTLFGGLDLWRKLNLPVESP